MNRSFRKQLVARPAALLFCASLMASSSAWAQDEAGSARVIEGTVSASNCPPEERVESRHAVSGASDVLIWVESEDFDPVLRVWVDGELDQFSDDGFATTLYPAARIRPTEGSVIEVEVGSLDGVSGGAYRFVEVPLLEPGHDWLIPAWDRGADYRAGAPAPVQPGLDVVSSMSRFYAQAGERLALTVESAEMDTTVAVFGPGGASWSNDDAADSEAVSQGTDSQVRMVAPQTGEYLMVVIPYDSESTDEYTARLSVAPPIMVGEDGGPPEAGLAGSNASGQIYAIL
ncbi:MAG: PPC domain-containing protein, partial [Myxococcales bacterium]|nr:PPC domain-containing protein [Myxococcales bacterium]